MEGMVDCGIVAISYTTTGSASAAIKVRFDTTSLDLHRKGIERIDLAQLLQLPKIESIDLSENHIHDLDLTSLVLCQKLERLNIASNPLKSLDVSPLFFCSRLKEIVTGSTQLTAVSRFESYPNPPGGLPIGSLVSLDTGFSEQLTATISQMEAADSQNVTYQEILREFDRDLKKNQNDWEALLITGIALTKTGQKKEGAERIDKALKLPPHFTGTLLELGLLLAELRLRLDAECAFDRMIEVAKTVPVQERFFLVLQLGLWGVPDFESHLRRTLNDAISNARNCWTCLAIGFSLSSLDSAAPWGSAREEYVKLALEKGLELARDTETAVELAQRLEALNYPNVAEDAYLKSAELVDNPATGLDLGSMLQREGHEKASGEAFRRAFKLAPDFHLRIEPIERLENAGLRELVEECLKELDTFSMRDSHGDLYKAGELLVRYYLRKPAIQALEVAIEQDKRDFDCRILIGKILPRERATEHLQAAVNLSPLSDEAWFLLGSNQRFRKKHSEAVRSFSEALKLNPSHSDAQLKRAESCLDLGEYDRSETDFRLFLKSYPNHYLAHLELARVMREQHHLVASAELLKTACGLVGHPKKARELYIRVLQELGEYSEAEMYLKQAIEQDGKNAKDLLRLGQIREAQEQRKAAIDAYKEASELDGSSIEAWLSYGRLLIEEYGSSDKPQSKRLLNDASEALYEAVAIADKTNHSLSHVSHCHLGRVLTLLREYKVAKKHYKRSIDLYAESSPTHMFLGVTHMALGEMPSAKSSFKRALALDPSCEEARVLIALVSVLHDNQQSRRLRGELKKVCEEMTPKTILRQVTSAMYSKVWYLIGQALQRMSASRERVRRAYERVLHFNPDHEGARKKLEALKVEGSKGPPKPPEPDTEPEPREARELESSKGSLKPPEPDTEPELRGAPEPKDDYELLDGQYIRLRRNPETASSLKRLYDYRCQVCKTVILTPRGCTMDVHHIKPRNIRDVGPDIWDNMIVLCPNHHREFDMGSLWLDPTTKTLRHHNGGDYDGKPIDLKPSHNLSNDCLEYASRHRPT